MRLPILSLADPEQETTLEFPETVTQEQLASILGVSTRQLRNLRDEIPPIEKEGRELVYPFPACLRCFVRYRESRVRAKLRNTHQAKPEEHAPRQGGQSDSPPPPSSNHEMEHL